MTVRALALADFESTIKDNPNRARRLLGPVVWPMPGVRTNF